MTIRSTFALLILPLFLVLVLANSALLYVRDTRERARGLAEEARSAAVVVAAFIVDAPGGLPPPERQAALARAAAAAPDLRGVTVIQGGRAPRVFYGSIQSPGEAGPGGFVPGPDGGVFRASVGAGADRLVVAEVRGAPLAARRRILLTRMGMAVALASVIGLGLSLWLSGRFMSDIGAARRWIDQVAKGAAEGRNAVSRPRSRIREIEDLVEAVEIMREVQSSPEGDDRQASQESAFERWLTSGATSRPLSGVLAGRSYAVRALGEARLGAATAATPRGEGGALALVWIREDAFTARSLVEVVRRYLEAALPDRPFDEIRETVTRLSPNAQVVLRQWTREDPPKPEALCLGSTSAARMARDYLALASFDGAEAAIEDLQALISRETSGLLAVIGDQARAATPSSAVG